MIINTKKIYTDTAVTPEEAFPSPENVDDGHPSKKAFEKNSSTPNLTTDRKHKRPVDTPSASDSLRESEERYRNLIENIEDIVYVVNGTGTILFVNRAMEKFSGYSRKELIGKNVSQMMTSDSIVNAARIFKQQVAGIDVGVFELEFTTKSGDPFIIETMERLIWEKDRIVEVHGIGRNVTEKRAIQQRITETQERYRRLVDMASDIIYQTDDLGRFILFNFSAGKLLGYSQEEIMGKPYQDLVHPGYRKKVEKFYGRQFVKNLPDTYLELPLITKNDDVIWIGQNVQLVKENGVFIGFQAIARDITDRKKAEDALKQSEEKHRTILDNIEEGYYEVGLSGRFTFFNDALVRIIGYPKQSLVGINFRDFMDRRTARRVFRTFLSVYRTKKPANAFDWTLIHEDGQKSSVEVSISLMNDSIGRPIGFRGIARDITERKKMEEELRKLSITDNLTGLFNQRFFYQKIAEEIKRARRMKYNLCLVLFDLDDFKKYNDTCGHLAGDEVLRMLGAIITSSIRENVDTGFRYGGDEFAIILPAVTLIDARTVADRIRRSLITKVHGIDISVGISTLKEGDSPALLIASADAAMYRQKGSRKKKGRGKDEDVVR